jgi:hypothetical protein
MGKAHKWVTFPMVTCRVGLVYNLLLNPFYLKNTPTLGALPYTSVKVPKLMKLGCVGACSSSFVELKCPITPMYLMERIVKISTMVIVYCNPSLCKELWVK